MNTFRKWVLLQEAREREVRRPEGNRDWAWRALSLPLWAGRPLPSIPTRLQLWAVPVEVAGLPVAGSHSPQPEGFGAQPRGFLPRQRHIQRLFSDKATQPTLHFKFVKLQNKPRKKKRMKTKKDKGIRGISCMHHYLIALTRTKSCRFQFSSFSALLALLKSAFILCNLKEQIIKWSLAIKRELSLEKMPRGT